MEHEPARTTELLGLLRSGRSEAFDELMELVYRRLHDLAVRLMRGERRGHTMQPTALVHEAYLKMVDQKQVRWVDRQHFFAVAAEAMRRVLVDHARTARRQKRGGDRVRQTVDVSAVELPARRQEVDLVELGDALERLSTLDERKRRVTELRFFAGLTLEEIAEALGVSRATVAGDWAVARAWLSSELS